MQNLKEIYLPKNLQDAAKILKKGKGKVAVLGGNTTLGVSSSPNIEGLLDIEPLKLNYIKQHKSGILIGAGATISDISNSKSVRNYCGGILTETCESIGKITNRNMITAGGNIVGIHPWSALPVVILALDAEIIVAGGKKKSFSAQEFFARAPKLILGNEGIVTEIHVPSLYAKAAGKYIKLSLTHNDYPIVSCAVVLKKKGAEVAEVRIAVGALTLLPQRLREAEKIIKGKALDEKLVADAARAAADTINIGNDFRVTKEYKKTVTENIMRDVLINLWQGVTT